MPITESLVADALSRAGVPTEPRQIHLPMGLVAQSEQPGLQLLSLEVLENGQVRARLTCKETHACLPFFAMVTPTAARTDRPEITPEQPSPKYGAALSNQAARLIAGQHATLTLEDAHMRITVPVIAIDTGQTGSEIRVTSLDRKQMYEATVMGSGLVRGVLP